MTGKVISLDARREANSPHTAGSCHCLGCSHEWVGVIPSGTFALECPKCSGMTGVRKGLVNPPSEVHNLQCDCGNDRFLYLETGFIFCDQCGQDYEADYGSQ